MSAARAEPVTNETHLCRAHPVEDALARVGDDELDDLVQVALDELAVARVRAGVGRRRAGRAKARALLVEERIEEEEEVDAGVEGRRRDLVEVAVPDVVGALGGVAQRERGDLGHARDR